MNKSTKLITSLFVFPLLILTACGEKKPEPVELTEQQKETRAEFNEGFGKLTAEELRNASKQVYKNRADSLQADSISTDTANGMNSPELPSN